MTTYYLNQFGTNTAPYETAEKGAISLFTLYDVIADNDRIIFCNGSTINIPGGEEWYRYYLSNISFEMIASDEYDIDTRPIFTFSDGAYLVFVDSASTGGGYVKFTGIRFHALEGYYGNDGIMLIAENVYTLNTLLVLDRCEFTTLHTIIPRVIYAYGWGGNLKIVSCIFSRTRHFAVACESYSNLADFIINNVFYDCGDYASIDCNGMSLSYDYSAYICQNIIYTPLNIRGIWGYANVYSEYNLIYNTDTPHSGFDEYDYINGCIYDQDPLFANKETGDFSLLEGSPCIGAGIVYGEGAIIPYSSSPQYDYMNTLYTAGLVVDLGAIIAAEFEFTLSDDYYFDITHNSQSNSIVNKITINTQPLLPALVATEVYRSSDFVVIAASSSITVDAIYPSLPVIEAVASIEETGGASIVISATTYYAFGASVTLVNNEVTESQCKIVVDGKILSVTGSESIVVKDDASIRENGTQSYVFPNNHLIQNRDVANEIATTLVASLKNQLNDISINWIGDPSIELRDEIKTTEYHRHGLNKIDIYKYYKIQLEFDGTLRSVMDGRKI